MRVSELAKHPAVISRRQTLHYDQVEILTEESDGTIGEQDLHSTGVRGKDAVVHSVVVPDAGPLERLKP